MDFGLRDWLLILGPLLIVGVLLHGYWRMRTNRNTLKMALDKSFMSPPGQRGEETDDLPLLRAELPNGGARVIVKPEQKALDLTADVPVLMEPVNVGPSRSHHEKPIVAKPIVATRQDKPPAPKQKASPRPEHFVVLYVIAQNEPFTGQGLLESLVEFDMQFGEMNLFHRLDENGDPLFSLVNAVEPGTFDLATMDELQTPAISLFMRAHDHEEPALVFDQMVEVANNLAQELGGEVRDQSRSVLTPQTIEHCREEILKFQLRYR